MHVPVALYLAWSWPVYVNPADSTMCRGPNICMAYMPLVCGIVCSVPFCSTVLVINEPMQ